MRTWIGLAGAATAVLAGLAGLFPGAAAGQAEPAAESPKVAVERGLAFLQRDAAAWKKERKCFTCHHGTMTLWAEREAKRQGYPLDATVLAERAEWARERLTGLEKPRDPRPGWNLINTPALYLAAMTQLPPRLEVLTPAELQALAGHVERHLEEDGSVLTPATMTPPLPGNGPPPIFESREVLTLFAVLALRPQEPADPEADSPIRDARKRAEAWLERAPPGDDFQAACLRLLADQLSGRDRARIRTAQEGLLRRQKPDGGWGQRPDLPSDAYATGIALYTLSTTGFRGRPTDVKRGAAFLVRTQQEDGAWPITPRAHPGAVPSKNAGPIRHYAAAWGVLGLLRAAPR